ncbi:MAG: recombinase family protein [Lachnospiraceae bacterium]|nr:recombinase family protein [Lachnospiraceae bacterium]
MKKLNVKKIEEARRRKSNRPRASGNKEQIVTEILDKISENRSGKRKITIIEPAEISPTNKKVKRIRVAAYCRVSTPEEAQVNSLVMQKQHFKRVISENPNYQFVKIYSDDGISGTSLKRREAFNQMMEDCFEGKIDMIYTKSISRFGRNIVDVLSSLRELANLDHPVTVYFEEPGVSTADGTNSILITILSAIAEMESQQKSLAISGGIRYRMIEGIYKFGVTNLLGYYRDYTGRIKVDEDEAEIVRYIYDAFISGASYSSIADALTEMGILSPVGCEKWSPKTIKSILTNEKYCGDVLYQKTYRKDFRYHRSYKNNGVLRKYFLENAHQPIISKEKWRIVQGLVETYSPRERKVGARRVITLPKYSRIKGGPLKNFYLIDMHWNKQSREAFIKLLNNR